MEQPKNNFKIVSDKKARMLLPNALGKSILAFLSDTILKLFLGCSISYLLANSVSPAIVFCPTLTNVS